ncbi:MAG: pentapeptide repeat-containing protein, partial [Arenimonas sp.]
TKQLERARLKDTILNDKALRDLLVTGQGQHQNYQGKNLKGAYLVNADLAECDLTEADISGANLERADLSRANLTKTQALGTNFQNAVLTGTCLEAWHIDSTTRLDGIVCDHVYLLNGQRERRPSSGHFGPGEFSKLFQEVLDTIDLIFNKGINWRAFMLSLDKLKVASGDADISVQSIENKGDGVFVVRLATLPGMDKEAMHSGLMQDYEQQLKLIEGTYRARLEAKQEIIDDYKQKNTEMTEIIKVLAQRPINVHNIAQSGDRNIEVQGNVRDSVLNQGESNAEVSISSSRQARDQVR